MLCLIDAQAAIHTANPACQNLTGFAPEECAGQCLLDFVHPEDRAVAERALTRLQDGQRPDDFECRFRCKDESVCWVSCSCSPPLGAEDLFLLACREISDRRVLEAEFVELTNRYEAAAAASGSIVYEWNTATDEVIWGGNYRSILGYASGKMARTLNDWVDLIHAEDQYDAERSGGSMLTDGEPAHLEYRIRRADGQYIHVRDDACFYRDASGKPARMIGCIRDITEQVHSQRELLRVKGRLELILQSIGDGICGLDAGGCVSFVNPAAAKMLGWPAEELHGKPLHNTCHHSKKNGKAYAAEQCPILGALHRQEGRLVVEDVFWRRDGTSFPVEYSATPIRNEDDVIGVVVTFRDVTERHRRMYAEQELRTARSVQRLLYPAGSPDVDGFDIAGAAFPAAMACGDYFDFVPLDDGQLAIAVGDVSGHGLGPALHMVQTRAFLRSTINADRDEVDVLRRLNELLMQNRSDDFFLTLFYARLDPVARVLYYAGAGHEARLLRADGRVVELPSTGIVLGVLDELRIENAAPTQLESGDVLLIATDGLTETYSPSREIFGWSRVLQVVDDSRDLPAPSIIERLKAASQHFANHRPPPDDVTIVVVRTL
jgi:PAS domain S-box-containing protein